MTAIDITILEASVEALIRQQVAEYEAQLRAALGRRLTPAGEASSSRRKRAGPTSTTKRKRAGVSTPRRSSEELDALGERFMKAVEATPGETMVTLAARLEVSGAALARPVLRLKRQGRIKTVGERNRTRYYPWPSRPATLVRGC